MTVSIIVNVHNGEKYIGECLDSILAQEGDSPIQVIIADDASTDSTPDILQKYRDPRFEVVSFEKNVGAAAAINTAFRRVRGEFVARIDYDDRYHSCFLGRSLEALRMYPDAAFVCASARMIDSKGVPGDVCGPGDYGEVSGVADRFLSMLSKHFVTAPTILGRTSHWRRAMPIPFGMDFCDWYMNLSMAETASVVVMEGVTADYRIHPLNMHTTKVRSGMGERVTFEVLNRFIERSPRRLEVENDASRIRAWHYADWGDKYFAANMGLMALRCYSLAVMRDPSLLLTTSIFRRAIGVMVGLKAYDGAKRLVRAIHR